jgi:hypothetical protein
MPRKISTGAFLLLISILLWLAGSGMKRIFSSKPQAHEGQTQLAEAIPPSTAVKSKNASETKLEALDMIVEDVQRGPLETAARDPFSALVSVVKSPKLTKVVLPTVVTPLPNPAPVFAAAVPSAPILNLRFTGRMVSPDGQQIVFAALADEPVTLSVGLILSNGYRVDSITERAVQLTYTALGTTERLDLPEPPKYEIR